MRGARVSVKPGVDPDLSGGTPGSFWIKNDLAREAGDGLIGRQSLVGSHFSGSCRPLRRLTNFLTFSDPGAFAPGFMPTSASRTWVRSFCRRHLQISTKRIRQFHLSRRLALHIKQRRTRHEYSHTLRTRGCDIQSVSAVQEFHSTWRILWS